MRDALRLARPHHIEFGWFAASLGVFQASRFVFSLGAAQALDSRGFTTYAIFLAFLNYAPALLLGTLNGVGRELPILVGAGRAADALRLEGVAWFMGVLVGALIVGLTFVVAPIISVPLVVVLPAALTTSGFILYQVQQFVLRSNLSFNPASGLQLVCGLVTLGMTAGMLVIKPTSFADVAAYYGVGFGIAVLIGLLLRRPRWTVDRLLIARTARIGFPIMAAGFVFSLLITLDRWIAGTMLPPADAAAYAFASIVVAALLVLPSVLSMQFYPRMAQLYGRQADPAPVYQMARRQAGWSAIATVPPAIIVLIGAALLVPAFFPRYQASVLPIAILTVGYVALVASNAFGNYLNVVGGQWSYLKVQLAALVPTIGLMVAGAALAGSVGIAAGLAIGLVAYSVGLWYVARAIHSGRHRPRGYAGDAVPLTPPPPTV